MAFQPIARPPKQLCANKFDDHFLNAVRQSFSGTRKTFKIRYLQIKPGRLFCARVLQTSTLENGASCSHFLRQSGYKLLGQHINSCSRVIHRRFFARKSAIFFKFFTQKALHQDATSVALLIHRSRGKTHKGAVANAAHRAPCAWTTPTCPESPT